MERQAERRDEGREVRIGNDWRRVSERARRGLETKGIKRKTWTKTMIEYGRDYGNYQRCVHVCFFL